MKELIGGLWLTGLLGWALLDASIGLIFIGIGCIAASWLLIKEKQAANKAASWRKNYPSYRY